MWGFCDLKQDGAGLQISDLETDKVDVVDIIFWFAEVPCKDDRQKSLIHVYIFAQSPAYMYAHTPETL